MGRQTRGFISVENDRMRRGKFLPFAQRAKLHPDIRAATGRSSVSFDQAWQAACGAIGGNAPGQLVAFSPGGVALVKWPAQQRNAKDKTLQPVTCAHAKTLNGAGQTA
jgi:hypothetical protein